MKYLKKLNARIRLWLKGITMSGSIDSSWKTPTSTTLDLKEHSESKNEDMSFIPTVSYLKWVGANYVHTTEDITWELLTPEHMSSTWAVTSSTDTPMIVKNQSLLTSMERIWLIVWVA